MRLWAWLDDRGGYWWRVANGRAGLHHLRMDALQDTAHLRMSEYVAVIEVWFEATSQEDADRWVQGAAAQVLADETVRTIEAQAAEPMD